MRFSKWHALGNSYIVVERADAGALDRDRARRLCDVDTGIGSDGVLEVVSRQGPRAEIVIWNPDGSIAEMSGNGVRIAARWLAGESGADEVVVVTAGRTVPARMLGTETTVLDAGTVVVGEPELLDLAGEVVELTPASLGNPHAVIRRDGATREDLLRIGPLVERHPRFPERTNVQIATPAAPGVLRVLVWERGAGETASSGSSAVAAAAVAVERGWCVSPVSVLMPGGELLVELSGGRALLTGPAALICRGEASL